MALEHKEYCDECSMWIEVDVTKGRRCSWCNPAYMEDDDLQPLDFSDELYNRVGD